MTAEASGLFAGVYWELPCVRIEVLSHGFLRRYAWTLDFEAMTMTFSA